MDGALIYKLNYACEAVLLVALICLLVVCFRQRKRLVAAKALMLLAFSNILLLLCQITEWYLMIAGSRYMAESMPVYYEWKKLTYTLDYSLYYFVSLAFYYYVHVHIRALCRENKQPYSILNTYWMRVLLVWGFAITEMFASLITTNRFYFLTETGHEAFQPSTYLIMYALGTFASVSVVIALIRRRKLLERRDFVLLLLYKIVPLLVVIPDLLQSTCLSYLILAVYPWLLYLRIDRHSPETQENT